MPKNIGNRKVDYKQRDLGGNFKSVTEFLNYYADRMNSIVNKKTDELDFESRRKLLKQRQSVLTAIHKARITTKQFKTFYGNKYMEK